MVLYRCAQHAGTPAPCVGEIVQSHRHGTRAPRRWARTSNTKEGFANRGKALLGLKSLLPLPLLHSGEGFATLARVPGVAA